LKKVTVIGSLNIDHVLKVRNLPDRGETIISGSYQLKCGGKGANQAAAIGRLGVEVNMIGKIGGDEAGRMQLESLGSSGVDTGGIIISKDQKTGAAFITVEETGENTIVLYPGTNGQLMIGDIEQKKNLILDSDAVVLQMEVPVETNMEVIKFSKENSKKIILSLAPAMEIDRKVLGMVDYLLVNEVEIKFLCGTEFDLENIGKSIMELRKTYKNNIIVTLGESGSILIEGSGKVHRQPAYRVSAVDSTGAGDAFTGGFILGLSMGFSLPECIEIGNAAGAFSVTRLGAQPSLPFREDLEKFLSEKGSGIKLSG
jgi:ribokinase